MGTFLKKRGVDIFKDDPDVDQPPDYGKKKLASDQEQKSSQINHFPYPALDE